MIYLFVFVVSLVYTFTKTNKILNECQYDLNQIPQIRITNGMRPTHRDVMGCDGERFNRFFHAMLERGIYLAPSASEAGFVSSAHTREDLDETVRRASEVFASL